MEKADVLTSRTSRTKNRTESFTQCFCLLPTLCGKSFFLQWYTVVNCEVMYRITFPFTLLFPVCHHTDVPVWETVPKSGYVWPWMTSLGVWKQNIQTCEQQLLFGVFMTISGFQSMTFTCAPAWILMLNRRFV